MIPRFRVGDRVHNKVTDEEAKVICLRPEKETPVYAVSVEMPGKQTRQEEWPESILESSIRQFRYTEHKT